MNTALFLELFLDCEQSTVVYFCQYANLMLDVSFLNITEMYRQVSYSIYCTPVFSNDPENNKYI